MFVSNRAEIFTVAKSCPHGFGVHQQITGVRMADGTFFSRLTAEYPQELANALATVIAPLVSKGIQFCRWTAGVLCYRPNYSGLKLSNALRMEGVSLAQHCTCRAQHLTLWLAFDPDSSSGSVTPNSA